MLVLKPNSFNIKMDSSKFSTLVRVSGRDKTARELIRDIQKRASLAPIEWMTSNLTQDSAEVDLTASYDYAQIDPELSVVEPTLSIPVTMPMSRIGYGGLTPQQRYRMMSWLDDPLAPAPDTIRQIYIAHLETDLLEPDERSVNAIAELIRLLDSDTWQLDVSASRALILGFWFQQDGDGLAEWFGKNQLPDQLLGIVAGHIALLGKPFTVGIFRSLLRHWLPLESSVDHIIPTNDILELRLTALETTLGHDLLAYALMQLSDEKVAPVPWRCTHRDLRLSIPQPNLEQIIKPLLLETLEGMNEAPQQRISLPKQPDQQVPNALLNALPNALPNAQEQIDEDEDGQAGEEAGTDDPKKINAKKWSLVLEFGHSRSEYFDFAIFRARQRPGYSQIMDEDRTLIHRVVFTKSEMRHFWPLWEYVQKWSSAQVYVNGTEVEKWKVWPHSQYLR